MLINTVLESAHDISAVVDCKPPPTVSVVMTTYNGARFVAEQIESILQQSFADFELVIADDCSTDRTVSLLLDYAKRDARIRVVANERNLGINRNMQQALSQAAGTFIAISDQDDIWIPRKLELLLQSIGDHLAVYSDSVLIDESGNSLGTTLLQRRRIKTPPTGKGAVALLRKNCVSGHALLFRRELLDVALPFDGRLMFDQQLGFFAAMGGGLVYVDEPLVKHRIHGGNLSNASLGSRRFSDRPVLDRHGSRLERYRRKRADLVERMECCALRMKSSAESGFFPEVSDLAQTLKSIALRMRRFDQMFFDVRLFFMLWSIRKQIFHADEDRGLHMCLKYAKGARYYAIAR